MNLLKGITYQRKKARAKHLFFMQIRMLSLLLSIFLLTYVLYNYQILSGNILSNPITVEDQLANLPGEVQFNNGIIPSVNAEQINFDNELPNQVDTSSNSTQTTTTESNYLKVSSVKIKGGMVQDSVSNGESAMMKGFWLYPNGNTPENDGTTLFFGHRYLHMPPRTDTFYNLDKIKIGDNIEIAWNGIIYHYQVIDTKVVDKTDWEAVKNENFKSIKLITCTPLGTDKQRIVVTAKLI